MTSLSESPTPKFFGGRPRATMKDVARLADVSLKTVSRVVNRESGVSDALVARVLGAADRLDYRLDSTASNLRRLDRRTATIGLLVEDVANEFSSAVLGGVEDVARTRNVAVLTASIEDDPEREQSVLEAFLSRRVDGLIVVPTGRAPAGTWIQGALAVPCVFVDRSPQGVAADCVRTTNREGVSAGVEHMIGAGHTKIAFIGGISHLDTARERYSGFLDALMQAGLSMRQEWLHRDVRSVDQATGVVARMMASPDRPTAIFSAQNLLTMGTFRALKQVGLQHSVAMVGFDDFALADMLDPAITVVAQNPRRIGVKSAELLFSKMDAQGEESSYEGHDFTEQSSRIHLVESALIVRESGAIPPP